MNEKRKKELELIKRLDMTSLVESAGVKVKNSHFKAIWRDDQTPSVSIIQASDGVWIWKDHGADKKGTNIDLFMLLHDVSYVQAVKALREQTFPVAENQIDSTASGEKKKTKKWKILDECELSENTLSLFKKHRGLEPLYLKEAKIKQLLLFLDRKKFSLCGHQNMAGGWELYNAQGSFKSATSKDLTYIKRNKKTLIIAESLVDAVSCEQIKHTFFDLLVLNSVEMINQAVNFLSDLNNYNKIVIATDNDKAGKKAADILLPVCKTKAEKVVSFTYNQKKDPNDYLKGKK